MEDSSVYLEEAAAPHSTAYVVIGSLYCSMMLVVGVSGNVAVIIVTKFHKELQSTSSAYFVSLSVAHLLMLVTAAIPEIVRYYIPMSAINTTSIVWSTIMFFQNMCSIATIISMALLSIERCLTWCCYKATQCIRSLVLRRTSTAIVSVWLASFVFAAPWIHFLVYFDRRYHRLHGGENSEHSAELTDALDALEQRMQIILSCIDALVWYAVPLTLIMANYIVIYRRISIANSDLHGSQTNLNMNPQLDFVSDSWMKTRASLKKSRCQLAKTLAMMALTYALCWLPFRIWVICNAVGSAEQIYQLDPWLTLFVRLLIYCNAAATPLIYCCFSYKFRRAFKLLLVKLAELQKFRRQGRSVTKTQGAQAAVESPDCVTDHVELAARSSISDASDPVFIKQHFSTESVHNISIASAARIQKY